MSSLLSVHHRVLKRNGLVLCVGSPTETVGLGKSGSNASIVSTGHMKSAHLVTHTTCARIVNPTTTCKDDA